MAVRPDQPIEASPEPVPIRKLAGRDYQAARAWFARLGYLPSPSAKPEKLELIGSEGRIVLRPDTREVDIHGRRVFLGDPVLLHGGELYVSAIDITHALEPILRTSRLPARSPVRTVVLDPGHGGEDSGTVNSRLKLAEKTFALDVALRLRRLLADDGWQVIMTREDDRFIPLRERAEIANRAGADVFVSIHFNAVAGNASVRGVETFVLTPRHQRSTSSAASSPEDAEPQTGDDHGRWSQSLGWHLHRRLLDKLKAEDRGLKRARFAVLRHADCPAVLVEAGYLSNDDEARRIAAPNYRGDIAEALAAGLRSYAAGADANRSGR